MYTYIYICVVWFVAVAGWKTEIHCERRLVSGRGGMEEVCKWNVVVA